MTAYALVRIKNGARCGQDFHFYTWPPSDYGDEGRKLAGVHDDAVFIARKMVSNGRVSWNCRTNGAGMLGGDYGNGGISVFDGSGVEMLTPLLGYEPELPPEQGDGV